MGSCSIIGINSEFEFSMLFLFVIYNIEEVSYILNRNTKLNLTGELLILVKFEFLLLLLVLEFNSNNKKINNNNKAGVNKGEEVKFPFNPIFLLREIVDIFSYFILKFEVEKKDAFFYLLF